MLVRDFLGWIIWGGKICPKIWATPSGVSAHEMTQKKDALAFFVPPPHCALAEKFLCLVAEAFFHIRTYSFRIPIWTEDQKLLGILWTPAPDWDCWDIQSHGLNEYWIIPSGDSHCSRTTVYKPTHPHPLFSSYQFCSFMNPDTLELVFICVVLGIELGF